MDNISDKIDVSKQGKVDFVNQYDGNKAENFTVKRKHVILLAGALFLGICANILFFDNEPGISVPLFVAAFYAVLFISYGNELKIKATFGWALSIPIILLSLTYLFYSNVIFSVLNFMALTLLIVVQTLLITKNNVFSWHTPGFIIDLLYAFFYRVFVYVAKPVRVITSLLPSQKKAGGSLLGKIMLGLIISIPLLFIVVSLLISADTVFESYINRIPNLFDGININEYLGRGIFILIVFAASFSFIFSLLEKKMPEKALDGDGSINLPKTLDSVIVITIMVLVNIIYLLFVVIQFAYLFGGASIALPETFTYSEYARRGFFELVSVTIINFGLILLFIGFTRVKNGSAGNLLRIMYTILVGNTAVMLVSAYYRMLLYEDAYGFTYLRVLTQAFMIFMLVLFGITLIRIWKDGFSLAKPFIITAIAAFVIVNYINVDRIIAAKNIERYKAVQIIDVNYLSSLSFDALSEIEKLKTDEDEKVATDITALLKSKKEKALSYDAWQSFNLSRYKAGNMVIEK